MTEREEWLEMKISQLHRAKERIEDETTRLKPYTVFFLYLMSTYVWCLIGLLCKIINFRVLNVFA
jgi:hypothetical protein